LPPPTGLLERSEQLQTLAQVFATVVDVDCGQMVLVSGDAGIGKTALVRGFCDHVDGSARVLWGACDVLFTPRPLGPLVDVAGLVGGELADTVESGAVRYEVASAVMRELESTVRRSLCSRMCTPPTRRRSTS
jgi:predicted ATPase